MMFKAIVVKRATFSWVLLVVIAWKDNRSSRFCVDYWALNKRMKPDKYMIQIIEPPLDKSERATAFSKPDMLAEY